jgi:catechol-2,3-dioxygenase
LAPSKIKALGEVNLRVKNLKERTGFYVEVLGLEVIHKSEKHVFLKVTDGSKVTPTCWRCSTLPKGATAPLLGT